jgi:outer membrane protein OmpA-like peptidoglycan-associated protein
MYKKEMDKTFVLKDIYYDFDKWNILPESEIELNKLIQIMRDNPDLKVELGSHTDARGRDDYNKILSQKRSESAVAYIISRNIDKSRLVAKGYGETQLINHCGNGVECSDSEHRQNRRTEFKIIDYLK